MSTIELDTAHTELVPSTEVELRVADTGVTTVPRESIVEGYKKEYSIVGDGLYARISADEAPAWLTSILDNVISAQLDSSLGELSQANQSILNSLSELEVAKNEYQELINIDATVEGVVASRLSTLNAAVDQNSATISSLQVSKVDENQAIAIAGNVVQAELDGGSIGARIGNLDTAIANTNGALASSVEVLEAQYDDVSSAVSTLENTVAATTDSAQAYFAYDATLKLDYNGTDYYYNSGFGLKTTLAGGTESAPSGNSEFWVRADKARFVDSSDSLILEGDSQGLTFPGAGSIKSQGYDLATNTGVFMGYNPTSLKYELMAGNGTEYLKWDGSSLSVKGGIEATSITVPEASIGTADIANAAITNAKIGDLAVTNAKISGVIQSSTFSTVNKTGWQLDKDGDGTFYGTVYAQSIEGDIIKNVGLYNSVSNIGTSYSTYSEVLPRNLRGLHTPFVQVSCYFNMNNTNVNTYGELEVTCNGITRYAKSALGGGSVSVSFSTPATSADATVFVKYRYGGTKSDPLVFIGAEITGFSMGLS